MLSQMTKLSFPEDIEINSDSLNCGGEKINFDEIKSIRVYLENTTTNLTAFTGIPTVSGINSSIDIILENDEKFSIHVANYEEWGGFKNKKGISSLKDGLAFATLLEEKTFDNRVQHYLNTGNQNMYFKYRGYEFLKDNTIRLGSKKFASFLEDEYEILQGFRSLEFKEKGAKGVVNMIFPKDERDKNIINLTNDADVILYLVKKLITQQL